MDGGLTWGSQVSPVTTDLNKIFFPSKSTGYISGASGVVLKTTNEGGMVTSTSELQHENSFSILNNPSNVEVIIKTNYTLLNAELIILNALGQKVEVRKNISGNNISLNTSEFPAGIYFFTLNNEAKSVSGKFVAE